MKNSKVKELILLHLKSKNGKVLCPAIWKTQGNVGPLDPDIYLTLSDALEKVVRIRESSGRELLIHCEKSTRI